MNYEYWVTDARNTKPVVRNVSTYWRACSWTEQHHDAEANEKRTRKFKRSEVRHKRLGIRTSLAESWKGKRIRRTALIIQQQN